MASSNPTTMPSDSKHHLDGSNDTTSCPNKDVEQQSTDALEKADIEHQPVIDDPRLWSPAFKWFLVAILSFGALIPTLSANIFFPVINDLQADLHASQSDIALSISLYILAQGCIPLLWSPISEIIGRKICFLIATIIFTISMIIIAAAAQNVATLIAFRVIGAGGSSAMLAIAAGTLADLYEPAERGVKVGIYYSCPLLGPALGPIFGGAFGSLGKSSWRYTFYFVAGCGAASFISFLFFKETFRTERSLAWQRAKKLALEKASALEHGSSAIDTPNLLVRLYFSIETSIKISKERWSSTPKSEQNTSSGEGLDTPFTPPLYLEPSLPIDRISSAPTHGSASGQIKSPHMKRSVSAWPAPDKRQELARRLTSRRSIHKVITSNGKEIKFRPSISDVSPLGSAFAVLKQPHNIITITYSGLAFASIYSLSYTASRTFSAAPYYFEPILIGVVLLALGIGGMVGSIVGGRLSDRALRKYAECNNGQKPDPELRILSVRWPMILSPATFVGYAWSAQYKTNIAIPIVCLVLLGFSLFWIYSSTLSFLIDSNVGRSSGAVACNSAVRGLFAFIASEVAGPLQDAVGDGPLYTGWAVLLAIGQVGLLFTAYHGKQWRDSEWKWSSHSIFKSKREES